MSALQFHPAFVSSRLFDGLPFANLLPDLTLEVDSIAEGVDTVGVEWHVQCGDSAFPLGRGLSQVRREHRRERRREHRTYPAP
jgi:hypothetical protein